MKRSKVIVAGVAILAIVAVAVAFAKSDYLQGRLALNQKQKCAVVAYDCSKLYMYKSRTVSGVTSPVTSVVSSKVTSKVTSKVISKVTSKGGTSKVASKVTSKVASKVASLITSPVTSAVAVNQRDMADVDVSSLKQLTSDLFRSIAKQDYKASPARFVLSQPERQRILNMYKAKSSR